MSNTPLSAVGYCRLTSSYPSKGLYGRTFDRICSARSAREVTPQRGVPTVAHNWAIALSMAANNWAMVASVSSPMFETRNVVPLTFP